MQHVGEIILRSALPRIRRLLHRQSRMALDRGEARTAAPAIRACALLLVAALRLSTGPSGAPVESPLLKNPTSADFLGLEKKSVPKSVSGGGGGSAAGAEEEENLDATLPPKDLAEDWITAHLRAVLEEDGKKGRDPLLVEAAAWATLRVLQTVAMGPLRASAAPRAAEAFLRVLLTGQVSVRLPVVTVLSLFSLCRRFLSVCASSAVFSSWWAPPLRRALSFYVYQWCCFRLLLGTFTSCMH